MTFRSCLLVFNWCFGIINRYIMQTVGDKMILVFCPA